MPVFPTNFTTKRGHVQIHPLSVRNAVNMVSAVYLTGISQLGSIFLCFDEIEGMTNFAEKLGRPKWQFSLPISPPKEDMHRFFQYQ